MRPTADRVKESLFGILDPWLCEAIVVDLCAGIGSLGIEALSRGARFCTFVETDAACRDALQRNLETVGFASRARILPMPADAAVRVLAAEGQEQPTVVLADPPYDAADLAAAIVRCVGESGLLAPDGLFCLERPARRDADGETPGLTLWQVKRYGRTALTFFRAAPPK